MKKGGYRHEDWDYGSSDADADVFHFGVSFDLGTGSLQDRVQNGASFNETTSLMDIFSRWD